MMHYSKNNIIVELDKDEDYKYVIMNGLMGHVDFLDAPYYQCILKVRDAGDRKSKRMDRADRDMLEQMIARGYVYKNEDEEKARTDEFSSHLITSMKEKLSNFYALIPENTCNKGCSYCTHQERLDSTSFTPESLDQLFSFISSNDKRDDVKEKPVLVLYGGESMPDHADSFQLVKKVLQESIDLFSHVSFYTFGFNVERYRQLILDADLKKMSFAFRLLENEDSDLDTLLAPEVEECFDFVRLKGIPTTLTLKITEDNVDKMPMYINELLEKGVALSDNCRIMFRPTLKKNCSIFSPCTTDYGLFEKILAIYEEYPQLEYGSFFGYGLLATLQSLLKVRERFPPRLFYCDANWNLYVLHPSGNVFPCYHAHRKDSVVGNISDGIDETALKNWRGRSVDTLPGCSDCGVKYICSGGCTYDACEKKGDFKASNCQPFEKLIKWYFENLYEDFMDSDRYETVPEE